MTRPKRVAAIHDISSFGRCSLTVIIPILSAMKIQCCPVPSAILSTHTGGFQNLVIQNTDEFMPSCFEHHQSLHLDMECIYSGFLAKAKQIEDVAVYFAKNKSTLKVVDPVMGDCGKTYKTITQELIKKMRFLVSRADIITPNPTEVSLLLNEKYNDAPKTYEEAQSYLKRLANLGPAMVIITGLEIQDEGVFNLGYIKKTDEYIKVECEYLPVHYPGTGDIFASVLVGSILKDKSFEDAIISATRFVEECIKLTVDSEEPTRDGVFIEYALHHLYEKY